MTNRLKYHFEPSRGWMNDPNGLVYFKGEYHAFFQHNPNDIKWGPMHWGHAVSSDLLNWRELPIALFPDAPYEDDGGCFSGSAVVYDDTLYLFYTSVSKELGQTQSLALSRDGVNFEKHPNNPIIDKFPEEGSCEFRDPKVTKIGDKYFMAVGSGKDGIGKVLLYVSSNLLNWEYSGVLYESREFGPVIECPDFFRLGDKYVLMFSRINTVDDAVVFVTGTLSGTVFTPETVQSPERGPHFYAPQTFEDAQGNRCLIAWLYSWDKIPDPAVSYAGAFTIPRHVSISDGKIRTYPISAVFPLLKSDAKYATVTNKSVTFETGDGRRIYEGSVTSVRILEDTKTAEVFINGGETSFSFWL